MSQAEVLKAVREIGPCTTMEVVRTVEDGDAIWRCVE